MQRASRLRAVPVGVSDEHFATQVKRETAVLVLQIIDAEGQLRVLGGESNARSYKITPLPDRDRAVLCGPGGEVSVPLRASYLIEEVR